MTLSGPNSDSGIGLEEEGGKVSHWEVLLHIIALLLLRSVPAWISEISFLNPPVWCPICWDSHTSRITDAHHFPKPYLGIAAPRDVVLDHWLSLSGQHSLKWVYVKSIFPGFIWVSNHVLLTSTEMLSSHITDFVRSLLMSSVIFTILTGLPASTQSDLPKMQI